MDNTSKTLLSALDSLQARAGFSSSGVSPFFFPGLSVDGIGEIAFPLSEQQASAFSRIAESAPYGKGAKTKHDEAVRKCWQLDAKLFSFKSPAWRKHLDAILEKVRVDLGITGRISAKPYKLLLYGKGGHFKAHRDTEKLDAMFGTLIVALPSHHEGGALHIRHGGRQATVDFSAEKHRHDFQHAAFFADCEHEVLPVKSGFRLCVVYNLVLEEGDPSLLNLTAEDHAGPLAGLLEKTVKSRPVGTPTVVLLQHQYTEANFSLQKLKGNDRQRAAALFAAAARSGLTARLSLATFYQMGELEDGYEYGSRGHRGRRGYDDPDEGTMGEVYEESFDLDHWRDADNRKLVMGRFPVSMDEVITAEDFSKIDPDEKAGEGYTGNAGCSMEYWYRRAAVVLWPEGCEEEIRCSRNLSDACETLVKTSGTAKTGPGTPFDKLARAAVSVLSASEEPRHVGYGRIDQEGRLPVCQIPLALARAGRADMLERLVSKMPSTRLTVWPLSVWKALFRALAPEAFSSTFKHWLGCPADFRNSLFAVLAALNAHHPNDPWVARIAAKLVRLKPEEIPRWKVNESRNPIPPGNLAESQVLFHASHALTGKDDIAAAVSFLKSDASLYAVRGLIGPLFTNKTATAGKLFLKSKVACVLLDFARRTLSAELARKLAPYPDWSRPCPPQTKEASHSYGRRGEIPVLQELAAFMADPTAREHAFRRREDQRVMLEGFIRDHFLDLDFKTIRQGSPHALLCTKNDRSCQHALQSRENDRRLLGELEAL